MRLKKFNPAKEVKKISKSSLSFHGKAYIFAAFLFVVGIIGFTTYALFQINGETNIANASIGSYTKFPVSFNLKNASVTRTKCTSIYCLGQIIINNNPNIVSSSDNDGTTYYLPSKDVFISFADKIWKLIRINGDGSIRIILNDTTSNTAAYGNDNFESSAIKNYYTRWYTSELSDYDTYVTNGKFCNDTTYGATTRVGNSTYTFNCVETEINNKVGLVTVDELMVIGANNGLKSATNSYYTISQNSVGNVYSYNTSSNALASVATTTTLYYRPVINLDSAVKASGTGTSDDPYVITGIKTEKATANANATYTIIPDSRYILDSTVTDNISCTNNQVPSYDETTNTYTIANISSDTVCNAKFTAKKNFAQPYSAWTTSGARQADGSIKFTGRQALNIYINVTGGQIMTYDYDIKKEDGTDVTLTTPKRVYFYEYDSAGTQIALNYIYDNHFSRLLLPNTVKVRVVHSISSGVTADAYPFYFSNPRITFS